MKVTKMRIPEVLLIEPEVHDDFRGYLLEAWSEKSCADLGIPAFRQSNVSYGGIDVLRGLHLQHPHAQGKLVHVLDGEIFDVAVDVRVGSPTFGEWVGEVLQRNTQLYIPPGFAHGFFVIATALVAYHCTELYHPESELGIRWSDPDLKIRWPDYHVPPRLSRKDAHFPTLAKIDPDTLPRYGEDS